jgi:uncharacterized membrane protein
MPTALTGLEEKLAALHPFLVHFPIVLFTLTLISDIANYIRPGPLFMAGTWLLWFGTFFCFPALLTGWFASKHYLGEHPNISYHLYFATNLTTYALLYSIFRYYIIRRKIEVPPLFFLALSLILLFITSYTSDYGTLITK